MAVVYGLPLFTTGLHKWCLLAVTNLEPLERNEIYGGRQCLASRFDFVVVIVRRCRNGELGIILLLDFQRPIQVVFAEAVPHTVVNICCVAHKLELAVLDVVKVLSSVVGLVEECVDFVYIYATIVPRKDAGISNKSATLLTKMLPTAVRQRALGG